MSLWNKIFKTVNDTADNSIGIKTLDSSRYAIIDVEVGIKDQKIHDIGALKYNRTIFHSTNKVEFKKFLNGVDFICGHNIIHHDARYLFEKNDIKWVLVDTLFVSPLLFPERPYHHLLKDDKLLSEQINNPVNDCAKAYDLLMDEVAQWNSLSEQKKNIYATLLHGITEFDGFLKFVYAKSSDDLANLIRST